MEKIVEVSLRQITKENYETVCELEVSEEQKNLVAENTCSILESIFEGYESRAIYRGEELVGFFMWVNETSTRTSIWRFMVDKKFQNKGIGRKALNLALKEIKQLSGLKEIEICYNPENPVAKNFYASFGFNEIGMDEDNEDMLAIISMSLVEQIIP
jgi:diamine N-acetyltransferase